MWPCRNKVPGHARVRRRSQRHGRAKYVRAPATAVRERVCDAAADLAEVVARRRADRTRGAARGSHRLFDSLKARTDARHRCSPARARLQDSPCARGRAADQFARRLKGPEKPLFSGEYWSGTKAVDLGLADGIGDLRTTLRTRFGDDVVTPLVAPARGWFGRLQPGVGTTDLNNMPRAADFAEEVISALEARALWARYGL